MPRSRTVRWGSPRGAGNRWAKEEERGKTRKMVAEMAEEKAKARKAKEKEGKTKGRPRTGGRLKSHLQERRADRSESRVG